MATSAIFHGNRILNISPERFEVGESLVITREVGGRIFGEHSVLSPSRKSRLNNRVYSELHFRSRLILWKSRATPFPFPESASNVNEPRLPKTQGLVQGDDFLNVFTSRWIPDGGEWERLGPMRFRAGLETHSDGARRSYTNSFPFEWLRGGEEMRCKLKRCIASAMVHYKKRGRVFSPDFPAILRGKRREGRRGVSPAKRQVSIESKRRWTVCIETLSSRLLNITDDALDNAAMFALNWMRCTPR